MDGRQQMDPAQQEKMRDLQVRRPPSLCFLCPRAALTPLGAPQQFAMQQQQETQIRNLIAGVTQHCFKLCVSGALLPPCAAPSRCSLQAALLAPTRGGCRLQASPARGCRAASRTAW